jgi:choline oxidase
MREPRADVVVVGGGASGAVLARRLAEQSELSVLLIEAGPSDENRREVLELRRWLSLFTNEHVSVPHPIEHQAWGESGVFHSRARILGGCSSHNGAIALQPPDEDFRRWEAEGAIGWGPTANAAAWQRLYERVTVAPTVTRNPLAVAVIEAGAQIGIEEIERFGSGFPSGVGWLPLNVSHGIRQSSSVAYLHPLDALPDNLTVVTDTPAQRVILDRSGHATAVQTSVGTISADQEIVLCGGAFETPKLLMLSGIGDPAQLTRHGIDVRVDLPAIGRHLLDHPETLATWSASRPVPDEGDSFWEVALFIETAYGPMMTHVGTKPVMPPGHDRPPHGLSITPNAANSLGEGTVRLRSADPADLPLIDPGYLRDPDERDLAVLIEGLRLARELARAPALADWLTQELCPGPELTSGDELGDYVRRQLSTVHHPAGTARMGAPTDERSVVDPQLRVIGVAGLRVADASIFPTLPSVNPCMTCMMIGERAAEIIAASLSGAEELSAPA